MLASNVNIKESRHDSFDQHLSLGRSRWILESLRVFVLRDRRRQTVDQTTVILSFPRRRSGMENLAS